MMNSFTPFETTLPMARRAGEEHERLLPLRRRRRADHRLRRAVAVPEFDQVPSFTPSSIMSSGCISMKGSGHRSMKGVVDVEVGRLPYVVRLERFVEAAGVHVDELAIDPALVGDVGQEGVEQGKVGARMI